ncbi:MAG: hypothetical protein QHH19_04180 [Candidatus Thermoplasmatota archaeon]|jgi:hypothetical protein|nr:hypothetical protein [Candidatus Thermoplasmatota archaeon]
MNRRRNKKSSNIIKISNRKVTRCSKLSLPVFENGICDEFKTELGKEVERNCKNCMYSF